MDLSRCCITNQRARHPNISLIEKNNGSKEEWKHETFRSALFLRKPIVLPVMLESAVSQSMR
ncbi:MAG TPA: hypothetical protein VIR77_00020 [Pontiella sp.]